MSRRIEIELTSKKSDSEWTWRAAGAKQPKGVVATSALYEGARVGDVCKADADFEIDGITITATSAPAARRSEAKSSNRIEVKGTDKKFEPVTSQLAPKRKGRDGDRRPRRDKDGDKRGPRQHRDGERRDRREGGEGAGQRKGRPARTAPERPTFARLNPGDAHRKAVLEELAPESRPIAEQVLRGGIPSVRQAIEAENKKAKEEGRPEVNADALISMAEEVLPRLKAAQWMDRATAAKAQVNEISLRDLRSVVDTADATARTEEARVLASELREALARRTEETRESWVNEISTCLEEGRSIRALRLSSRPPDPQTKFPPELLERLKETASNDMSPGTAPDRWVTLLEAVSASPVRRNVEPKGLPEEPGEELLQAARQAAGRIPALAKMLNITMPPPPRPVPPKPASAS